MTEEKTREGPQRHDQTAIPYRKRKEDHRRGPRVLRMFMSADPRNHQPTRSLSVGRHEWGDTA